jgi:putative ABC transport system permease protein
MPMDLRRALRLAAARPGAWLLLVVTLALGIAAPTLALSLADAVLWHPLSFHNADRLVRVRADVGPDALRQSPAAERWLAGLFPFGIEGATVDAGAGAQGATIGEISPGLFQALGVAPASGRLFAADEFSTASPVVVASASLGAELRARAPNRDVWTVRVDGVSKTVIGVMPQGFDFPVSRVSLWEPIAPTAAARTFALGVLKPGETPAAVAAAGAADWPGHATVTPFVVASTATVTAVGAFAGAACLVFIVALANAAGLQLASAAEQRHELAIRTALGASLSQLARAVLVETLLATAVACALALLLTAIVLPLIVRTVPYLIAFQTLRPVHVDAWALAVAAVASLAAAAVAATVAIARLRHVDPRAALGGHGAAGGSPRRARRVLTAVSIAVAVPILAGAGLLANSLGRLADIQPGFRTAGLLQALLEMPAWRYPTEASRRDALGHLRDVLMETPGVARVTVASTTPPAFDHEQPGSFIIEGRSEPPGIGSVSYDAVDDAFFDTVGIAIVAGRGFDGRDIDGGERVAIVSRTLAHMLWPASSAVGRRFKSSPDGPWRTVVGVAADITTVGADRSRGRSAFYLPSAQTPASPMTAVVIRTRTTDATAAMPAVRGAMRAATPDAPVIDFGTVADWLTAGLGRERFLAGLVTAIAAAALVLALVGIYATFYAAVRSRTREIGVRMSLGATPGRVMRAVLGESALVAAGGLVIGVPLALVMTRALSAWLFQVSSSDPVTYGAVALVVLLSAMGAACGPARRAARVDPAIALRES